MCRRIQRLHLECEHWHAFFVIKCDVFKKKKEKRLQKQGFWSKLLGSKPTCKTVPLKQSKLDWCPFCTRAQNLVYPSDEFGMELDATGKNQATRKSNFREELLSGGPSRQDLTMPHMPPNLRNSFLDLATTQSKNRSRQQMPEIRSNIVDPGIDFERWSHERDHILPPSSGPPPDKPLPPTPLRCQPTNVQKQVVSASQGRVRDVAGQRIQRKPVAGQSGDSYPRYNSHQVDGPAGAVAPLPRPQTRRREPPMPLVLDKDRELPDFLPWIPDTPSPLTPSFLQNAGTSGQDLQTPATPARCGGSGTNRSREKPNKFQSLPVSPLTPDIDMQIRGSVPNRRAQTISGRHENIRSIHGDIGHISPRLERIDDIEHYWMTAGAGGPEENVEMPRRAETEPIQHKGKRKAKTGRKIKFDDLSEMALDRRIACRQ